MIFFGERFKNTNTIPMKITGPITKALTLVASDNPKNNPKSREFL